MVVVWDLSMILLYLYTLYGSCHEEIGRNVYYICGGKEMAINLLVSCSNDVESLGMVETIKSSIDSFNASVESAFGGDLKIDPFYWKEKGFPKITSSQEKVQDHLRIS